MINLVKQIKKFIKKNKKEIPAKKAIIKKKTLIKKRNLIKKAGRKNRISYGIRYLTAFTIYNIHTTYRCTGQLIMKITA